MKRFRLHRRSGEPAAKGRDNAAIVQTDASAVQPDSDPTLIGEVVPSFMTAGIFKKPRRRRPSKRFRFAILPVLELAALACVLMFGGGAFMLWRLQQGPVSLDWARGYIEQSLAADGNSDSISIGGLTAGWSSERQSVQLIASRVDSLNDSGERVGRTNKLVIELSPSNLLHGRSVLSRFDADGGLFSLVVLSNGKVEAGIGAPDAVLKRKVKDDPERLAKLIEAANDAWRGVGPAGGIDHVSVKNAQLILFDQKSGHTTIARGAQLGLLRDNGIVTANFRALLDGPGGRRGDISAMISGSTPGPLNAGIIVNSFNPYVSVPQDLLPVFSSVDAPVTGSGSLQIGGDGKLRVANLALVAGPGKLRDADGARAFSSGTLAAQYDLSGDTLRLSKISANAEGIVIDASGSLTAPMRLLETKSTSGSSKLNVLVPVLRWTTLANKHWDVPKKGELRNLRIDGEMFPGFERFSIKSFSGEVDRGKVSLKGDIGRDGTIAGRNHFSVKVRGNVTGPVDVNAVVALWPPHLAKGAREWIGASIKGGDVRDATINVDVSAADQATGTVQDRDVSVSFAFEKGAVQPYRDSFLLEDLVGKARLGGNTFKLTATGRSGTVRFTSGSVDIGRLHPKGAPAVIRGSARGDLGGFAKMFATNLDAAEVARLGGEASANFYISRPMLSDVPWDDYVIDVKGAVNNARVENVVGPLPLEAGRFDVVVDRDKLVAKGAARIGGQPANLIWQETIRPTEGPTSQVSIASIADATVLDSFGVPSRASVRGSFSAAITASGERLHFNKGAVSLDLAEMSIAPEGLSWRKPKGTPGQFMLTFGQANANAPTSLAINSFANGASLNATAYMAKGGMLSSGDVNRFYIPGAFDLGAKFRRTSQQTTLDIKGPLAEGRTVLGLIFGGDDPSEKKAAAAVPMVINASFDQILAGSQPTLKQLLASSDISNGVVTRTKVSALTVEGKKMSFSIVPDAEVGDRKVRLDTDDLGAAARFVFKEGQVVGGRGFVEGRLVSEKGSEVADLKLRAKDFELRGTPALGRILTLGSLRGLADVLNGDGIKFSSLYAPMKVSGNTMQIYEARAAGPAIGITVKGGLNFDRSTMDLNGVLAPSYGVNSFLGSVPIVGGILVSRKGEGVFGMTYSMVGPFETARTTVNPLSVLTPGILRRIFEPGTPVADKSVPAKAPE